MAGRVRGMEWALESRMTGLGAMPTRMIDFASRREVIIGRDLVV